MSGTVVLNLAQLRTLQRSVEEMPGSIVSIVLNPGVNRLVHVGFKTPGNLLEFRIDQHGKRLPRS